MPTSNRKKAPKKVKDPIPVRNDLMFNSEHPLQFPVMEDIAKDKKVDEKQVFEKPKATKDLKKMTKLKKPKDKSKGK
jgi:hypothetical protein